MESSGRPEQVHISDKTSKFLNENYVLEEGEEVDGNAYSPQKYIRFFIGIKLVRYFAVY